MKVIVADKTIQDSSKRDFFWTEEGEIVSFGVFECENEEKAKECGCRRSLVGIKTRKACTTFRIAEVDFTELELSARISISFRESGWGEVFDVDKKAKEFTKEIIEMVEGLPVGTLLRRDESTGNLLMA